MKKTLIASAIALTSIAATNANANLSVTAMNFGNIYAATGSINDDGTLGSFQSVDNFFYQPWTATQETAVITNSNGVTWAGSTTLSAGGSWDFAADIAAMSNTEVAVGALFNWNTNNGIAVLAVFDCVTTPGTCIGNTDNVTFGGMQNGPFPGSVPGFNGNGSLSAVPVPAAVWLMGSGLLGLVGVARRRKVA